MTMNQRQQALVLSFLEQIYEAQQSLDLLSKRLTSLPNYSHSVLFQAIAAPHENITPFSMQIFLRSRIPCNPRGLYDLFQRFDSQRVGYISHTQFERQLTPVGVQKKENAAGQLTTQIETAFLAWVNESLHRLHVLQVARKEVCLLSPSDAFAELDSQRTGSLGLDELKDFFAKNDFILSDTQLRFLLHGLRRRHYTHVNLEVFCENLCPLEFGEYAGFAASMDSEAKQAELSRSRCEEESMRLSRQQTQKLEHEHHRAERKRQAELEREIQFQHKLREEMQARELDQSIRLRKALLEEDRAVRYAPIYQEPPHQPSPSYPYQHSPPLPNAYQRGKNAVENNYFQGKIQRQNVPEDKYYRNNQYSYPLRNQPQIPDQRTTKTFEKPYQEQRVYDKYRSPQQQRQFQDPRSYDFRAHNSDNKNQQPYHNKASALYTTPRDQINKYSQVDSRMRGTAQKGLDYTRMQSNVRPNPKSDSYARKQPSLTQKEPIFTRERVPIVAREDMYERYERQHRYDYGDSSKRYGLGRQDH